MPLEDPATGVSPPLGSLPTGIGAGGIDALLLNRVLLGLSPPWFSALWGNSGGAWAWARGVEGENIRRVLIDAECVIGDVVIGVVAVMGEVASNPLMPE